MRRRVLIVLLALGTVGGYASGFSSLRHRSQCRRAWMEERAPQACAPCPTSVSAPASATAQAPASPSAEAPTPSEPR